MDFLDNYFKYEIGTEISGLTEQLNVFYLTKLQQKHKRNIIVLTSSLYEANKIYNEFESNELQALLFPMDDFLSSMVVASSPELKYKRLETLDNIKFSNTPKIIVTNLMGYLKFLPNKNVDNTLLINTNDNYKRDSILESLEKLGYRRESLVTASGEYAVRGFLIDIYPIDEVHPIRIEFDGNTVESIKYFDENTQFSTKKIDKITIKAIDEIMDFSHNSLYDYLENPIVAYIDKTQIDASYLKLLDDVVEYKESKNIESSLMYELDQIKDFDRIYINLFSSGKYDLKAQRLINYNEDFVALVANYDKWISSGKEVYFYLEMIKKKKKY